MASTSWIDDLHLWLMVAWSVLFFVLPLQNVSLRILLFRNKVPPIISHSPCRIQGIIISDAKTMFSYVPFKISIVYANLGINVSHYHEDAMIRYFWKLLFFLLLLFLRLFSCYEHFSRNSYWAYCVIGKTLWGKESFVNLIKSIIFKPIAVSKAFSSFPLTWVLLASVCFISISPLHMYHHHGELEG